jgi:hypothetical protein
VIILGGGVSKKFNKYGKYLKGIHAKVIPAELRTRLASLALPWLLKRIIVDEFRFGDLDG